MHVHGCTSVGAIGAEDGADLKAFPKSDTDLST